MRVSAKADYAVRAAVELAAAGDGPVKGEQIATTQGISLKFLENILSELRVSGIVCSRRGAEGGYWLARPAGEISIADVMRAVEGPLASVRGERPEALEYAGAAEALGRAWIALRTNLRSVLETITLEDLAANKLPARIEKLAAEPESWRTR